MESSRDETIRRLAGENAVPKPCRDGVHTPCIVSRCGGKSVNEYNTCGACGEQIVICEDSWVALKDTILCKRCNGDGDVPSKRDELERVSCPVCDGQPHIDYGMVAEYARQIEYYVAQCAKANSALLQIARLATGWKAGNEGAHLLNIYKLAAREVISEPKEKP